MKIRTPLVLSAALLAAACTTTASTTVGNIPEPVALAAAPGQDLTTARLRMEDGCYWYLHDGPVEATLIPLRTLEGRPICTQAAL